jgi:hypothetical protein
MINAQEYFKIDQIERDKMRHNLIEKGDKFYQEFIEPKMKETDIGKFVVIEPDSKQYFIGTTSSEAFEKAEKNFPNKSFYLVKIGFRTPNKIGGFRGSKR